MCRLIAMRAGKVLLTSGGELPGHSLADHLTRSGESFTFSDPRGDYLAVSVTDETPPAGYVWVDLRQAALPLGAQTWERVGKGAELLTWQADTRCCCRCGAPMQRASGISMRCSSCGYEVWPHVAPCIIVLVQRGCQALLVHAKTFSRPFFGLVAGFVETGETLEECVRREVMEETGIAVTDIEYVESQPWPFPSQLMIGFTARCAPDAEPRFLDGELTEGGFFNPDPAGLPMLPGYPSVARRLIDRWLALNKL